MKILFIKLGALGDILMTTPSAELAFTHGHQADYLCGEEFRAVIENNPHISRLYTLSENRFTRPLSSIFRLFQLMICLVRLKKENYDRIINLHPSKAIQSVGRLLFGKKQFSVPQNVENWNRYHADVFLETTAHAVNISEKLPVPELTFTPVTGTSLPAELAELQFIVFHPGGGVNSGESVTIRRWPTEHWITLAKMLINAGYAGKIVITGGKTDSEAAKEIADALPPASVISLCAKTSLSQLAVVLKDSDLCITGDTGAMHLAGAVKADLLALIGPTEPEKRPYILGRRSDFCGTSLPCAPCYFGTFKGCRTGKSNCMEEISPSQVFTAASEILHRSTGKKYS